MNKKSKEFVLSNDSFLRR